VPECDDDKLNALLASLLEDVRRPLSICGHTLNTTISAGVSLYPQDGETLHELKLKADAALHHVKDDGRNGWARYRTEMSTAIPAKPGFLQELSQALERDQFELWYQPTWYAERLSTVLKPFCAGGILSKALCCLVCLSPRWSKPA
jgi:predicted signal transduction protein with EAL and GGDEF domain